MDLRTHNDVQQAVDAAAASPYSFVFVHVDWAPMHVRREIFEEFVEAWGRERPDFPVSFHYIDFTAASDDYEPITSLPGWTETRERIGGQPFAGIGEIAWIENGTLVNVQSMGTDSTDALISTTDSFFCESE